MSADRHFDVCIRGGGPAGLACAIAFAQHGARAAVVDHSVPPIDKACGEGLMPDSLDALQALGVSIPLHAGFALQGIRFFDAESSVEASFPSRGGLALRRTVLHECLRRRAEELGVAQFWGGRAVAEDPRAEFHVGADGQGSAMRRKLGLVEESGRQRQRFGFRQHFRIAPASAFVEVGWTPGFQVYVTPVADDEISLAVLTDNPLIRVEEAVRHFPAIQNRLRNAVPSSPFRGALSVQRRLRRVCQSGGALVGDASGSVDAITGEGLGLAFRQALALADAVRVGDVGRYERAHRVISRRARAMAEVLLLLSRHDGLRRRVLRGLERHPSLFASLLALHVGNLPFSVFPAREATQFCAGLLRL